MVKRNEDQMAKGAKSAFLIPVSIAVFDETMISIGYRIRISYVVIGSNVSSH